MNRTILWRPAGPALLLAAVLLGAPAARAAQTGACPDGDTKVARVDVTVDASAGTVVVVPSTVEIYLKPGPKEPARVCWVISGLMEGHSLQLVDKEADGTALFPELQRTVKSTHPFINSGNPSKLGTWSYGVTVTDEKGKTVAKVDPEVIVKGGSS